MRRASGLALLAAVLAWPAVAAASAGPSPSGRTATVGGVPDRVWSATFEDGRIFPPYDSVLTEGRGRQASTRLVGGRARGGRVLRMVMPPSRGWRRNVPNRLQLGPTGAPAWRHGDDLWLGLSLRIGGNWRLDQVADDRRHFATLLSLRWRDISHRRNGPGGGIKLARVRGDSRPHFVAERETRGWRHRDGGGRDRIDLGPVVKGRWIDFVIHIRWSAGRRGGLREYWRDGRLMGRSRLRNMGTDSAVIHRMGLYQGTGVGHHRTLHWDDHRIGLSHAQVDPSRR